MRAARTSRPLRSVRARRSRAVPHAWLRRIVLSVLLGALWIVLIGWAADAPWSLVFEPEARIRHDGAEFAAVMGSANRDGRRLDVKSFGAEHMALQSRRLERPIEAGEFPVLRYRLRDFPRTLELSFVFRRAEDPADVQTITLPPAGAHPAYFDLSDVPAWRGRILEIGFAQFPAAQLVPSDVAPAPFELVEAELWSPSWRGSLGALGTDWLAYRPWALMSVSALGPDAPWPHKPTPVIVLAAGLGASIVLAALIFARSFRWIGSALAVATAFAWLALDLRWLGELGERHVLTRELYAGKPWYQRAAIEPDTSLIAGARRVHEMLAREPADTRVIVAADSVYDTLRLDYHLLPANVAPVSVLDALGDERAHMANALLVVYDAPDWTFDASGGVLRNAGRAFAADRLLDHDGVRIFRLRGLMR